MPTPPIAEIYDLAVIGGGINGVGIAADAAGRGLSVFLCERDDLAQHTSSASSKLIHGGLRYLEHYEFRLVREALAEREVLLAKLAGKTVAQHRQALETPLPQACCDMLWANLSLILAEEPTQVFDNWANALQTDGAGSQAVLRAAYVANDLHRDSSFHEQLTTTDRNLHKGFHLSFIN